eukprot:4617128-Amphidinium_carterae.1
MKILVKPGVERTNWPDGVPLSAPSRSQRPPYISSMVWTSLHPSQRILETDRWNDWAEEGITNLQTVTRYRERGSSVAKTHFVHKARAYTMSESPEFAGKRKWISEQRADPPPGAQSKAKTRLHVERTPDWHVVDMNDTP